MGYFPNLSFQSKERRAAAMESEKVARGAPDLAIEVVSSEEAEDLEAKIEDYLAYGSRAVWVLYPERPVMRVPTKPAIRGFYANLTYWEILPCYQDPRHSRAIL
jgi:Uma2 family endonuclease